MSTSQSTRLDRVESEMSDLKQGLADVRSDVKGLGGILHRIEQSVIRSQEQQEDREAAKRHSPVAVATVLVTFMGILVGGAWTIGSQSARTEVRLNDQEILIDRMAQLRGRELDVMERRVDRLEDDDRGVRGQSIEARQ